MNSFDNVEYAPPPPAYTEQEFDQKVSLAVELSHQAVSALSLEDEWEPYDPAAFEAAAAQYNQNHPNNQGSGSRNVQSRPITPVPAPSSSTSSSSRVKMLQVQNPTLEASSTPPLRIQKKKIVASDGKTEKDKVRMKWEAADRDAGASSGSTPQGSQPYNAYDGDDIAPPPFAEMPPEAYHATPQLMNEYHQTHGTRSHFQSASPAPTQPRPLPSELPGASPLPQVPAPGNYQQHQQVSQQPPSLVVTSDHVTNHQRQSMAVSPSQAPYHQRNERRPLSEVGSSQVGSQWSGGPSKSFSTMGSVVQFNPSVAYSKPIPKRQHPMAMRQEEPPMEPFDPASLYNASVVSHIQGPSRSNLRQEPVSGYPGHSRNNSYGQVQYGGGGGVSTAYNGASSLAAPSGLHTWSPVPNRPMSTHTVESSYSDQQYGLSLNRYASPGPPGLSQDWQRTYQY